MTLPAPAATYSDDFYRYHWADFGVEFLLERFSETKDDIRAELTVNFDRAETGGRLYSGRLLLMGPNSRRDVKNLLDQRTEEMDWGGMLEQVCRLSRERYRRGEPVVDLYTVPSQEGSRFWVEPFILVNGITILYGDGATAKSSLALYWALEMPGTILYLDWEDDATVHAERLRALGGDQEGKVFYQRRTARLSESVRDIRRTIAERDVVLVIVDSLGMAAGDPNDTSLTIEALRACRALGVSVLAIHHLPKDAKDKSKPFGSVYSSNEARLTWLVQKTQEEDADEFEVLLTNHKANRSRLYSKQAFRIRFQNQDDELVRLIISRTDAKRIEAFRAHLSVWQHVVAILGDGRRRSYEELRKAMEDEGRKISVPTLRTRMNEHKREFVNMGSERAPLWALAVSASEEGVYAPI